MRRGFKAAAEKLALETRATIGLDAEQRLDPAILARHLSIPIITLDDLRHGAPEDVEHLLNGGSRSFSGVTVLRDDKKVIVINEAHPTGRQSNTLAHELSHVLLEHPAGPAFNWGSPNWKQEYEDEADHLAGCLLAPRKGLIPVMTRLDYSLQAGADHYAISLQLMRQRWHQTGAAMQVKRARARRR